MAAFSPDGKLVASAGQDGTVAVVERADGKPVHLFRVSFSGMATVAFSPDGKTLAAGTGGPSCRLLVWDLATGREVACLKGYADGIDWLAFHPAGRLAATGSVDGSVRLWDLFAKGVQSFDFKSLGGRTTPVAFTPEGRYLAVGNGGGTVCILKVPGEIVLLKEGSPTIGPIDLLKYADPRKDTVKGNWTRQKTDLVASGGHAILELPYWPPAEYDFLAEFTLDPQKAQACLPWCGDGDLLSFRRGRGRLRLVVPGRGRATVPGCIKPARPIGITRHRNSVPSGRELPVPG